MAASGRQRLLDGVPRRFARGAAPASRPRRSEKMMECALEAG